MKREKGLDAKRFAIITLLFAALVAVSLATTGCNDQMARMNEDQTTLQTMVAANSRELSTISSQVGDGQGYLGERIAALLADQQRMQAEMLAMREEQNQFRQTVADSNQRLAAQLGKLEENQSLLRDGVTQVASLVQTTNGSVSAIAREQATLHRMVQQNKAELAEAVTAVARNQELTHAGLTELRQSDRALAGQISGVATTQGATQALVRDNNEQVLSHLATIAADQGQLSKDLAGLHRFTQIVAADVTAVAQGQTALHGTLRNQGVTLTEKIALVEQHQNDLQSLIDQVANTAAQTARNVTTLAEGQAALEQQQAANQTALTQRLAAIAVGQEDLQTGVRAVDIKADRTATQIASLASGQAAIERAMAQSNETVTSATASLAQNQRALEAGVSNLNENTSHVAAGQASLRETVQTQLADLGSRTDRIASGQSELAETLRTSGDTLAGQVAVLDQTQRQVLSSLDNVAATQASLGQTVETSMADLADETAQVVTAQWALTDAVGIQREALSSRMAALTQSQQQVIGGLNEVAATNAQLVDGQSSLQQTFERTIADLTDETALMADEQWAFTNALNTHQETLSGQMTDLAETQGQMQQDLETVTATAARVATDVTAIDEQQLQLAETVTTDRQTLAAGLARIAQGQQEWLARIDHAGAGVQAATSSITALEQRLADLQGTFEETLSDVTTQLDGGARQQTQFEQSIYENMQAMADWIGQLRTMQGSLQRQMEQIQTNTQNQNRDILSALEQLQERTETNLLDTSERTSSSSVSTKEVLLP